MQEAPFVLHLSVPVAKYSETNWTHVVTAHLLEWPHFKVLENYTRIDYNKLITK